MGDICFLLSVLGLTQHYNIIYTIKKIKQSRPVFRYLPDQQFTTLLLLKGGNEAQASAPAF